MHILITDSGVGGLSVVAYAEHFVRTHGFREPVQLTFANAAPENDYGYNAMPTREEKLATFDRFLRNVTARFAPDSIYIACNTLSVLLPDTPFFTNAPVPIRGIVETAAALLLRELEDDPSSVAMIFGTQTTIDAGAYPRMLMDHAIDASRIITQACPRLADTISEDREGTRTAAEIRHWVRTAIAKMQRKTAPVLAALACTHYGYRRDVFADAFAEAGIAATVINPNERAVDDLFGLVPADRSRTASVRFVTRYRPLDATIDAITYFLEPISPATVAAIQHFEHQPDLF